MKKIWVVKKIENNVETYVSKFNSESEARERKVDLTFLAFFDGVDINYYVESFFNYPMELSK